MGKFKIGDKVRVREWDDMAKEFGVNSQGDIDKLPFFTPEMKPYCGKVVTIDGTSVCGWFTIKESSRWKFCEGMFEPVNKENTIIIYTKGNKVVALDKNKGMTFEAICGPDDKFDFYTGADIAFERLRGRKEAPKAREEEAPKYFTGEVVCIKCGGAFTVGKIYKVKNGVLKKDNGCTTQGFESVDALNKYFVSQFIEVKR